MFYDFMTFLWGALLGALVAVGIVFMTGGTDRGVALGVAGGIAMLVAVMCWRYFKRPE